MSSLKLDPAKYKGCYSVTDENFPGCEPFTVDKINEFALRYREKFEVENPLYVTDRSNFHEMSGSDPGGIYHEDFLVVALVISYFDEIDNDILEFFFDGDRQKAYEFYEEFEDNYRLSAVVCPECGEWYLTI